MPVQTLHKLWCNIPVLLDKLTHGKCTKKVSTNIWLKVAYFKLCTYENVARIDEDTVNTLDLWRPWTMQQYVGNGKFIGRELKYKDLLFLQRNDDGSYCQPFN